eukprot:GEMP01095813.1.p1 GENE.GEMP01095813.1~~GEMP01095813.1.p1  ORF type:complete len:175 (+),score=8.97 GEMP01095813.1:52-576(+)
MITRPLPEVDCLDGSIEALCRGIVIGATYAVVFCKKPALQKCPTMGKYGAYVGGWAFLTSVASCGLEREIGLPYPGLFGGILSGSTLAMVMFLPRWQVIGAAAGSGAIGLQSRDPLAKVTHTHRWDLLATTGAVIHEISRDTLVVFLNLYVPRAKIDRFFWFYQHEKPGMYIYI